MDDAEEPPSEHEGMPLALDQPGAAGESVRPRRGLPRPPRAAPAQLAPAARRRAEPPGVNPPGPPDPSGWPDPSLASSGLARAAAPRPLRRPAE